MRRNFVNKLIELAEKDEKIFLISIDIGFGVLEPFIEKFPERFINTGVREMTSVGVAAGLASEGKIPFVYTINPFLVFRAFEQIRMVSSMNDLHLILIGVGKEDEYTNQGISHYSFGDEQALNAISHPKVSKLKTLTPINKEDILKKVEEAYKGKGVYYLRLSRF